MLHCFCHVLLALDACKLSCHTLFICSAARVTGPIVYDMSVLEKTEQKRSRRLNFNSPHFFNTSIGALRNREITKCLQIAYKY